MRQAITTKFLGPTNFRGSRVKARAEAGSVTVEWDHALDPAGNHARAAKALAEKKGWAGRWIAGGLPSTEGNCYVVIDSTGEIAGVDFFDVAVTS